MQTISTVHPFFSCIVKHTPRRRSVLDGRRFVAWFVASYVWQGIEWRHAKEFPVGTTFAEAEKQFPQTITRAMP